MKKLLLLLAVLCAISVQATERSSAARLAFVKIHACPATKLHKLPCRGYVIDHVRSLDCGGLDAPANMQWQTIAQGKAKDKVERNGPTCRHRTHGSSE